MSFIQLIIWTLTITQLLGTYTCILTWILGVVSKQLRQPHGKVGDSTTSVNSLSPQMSELVEDAVASWCGYIVGHFWLIRNELHKFVELKFEFISFNTFDVSQIFWQRVEQPKKERQKKKKYLFKLKTFDMTMSTCIS